MNANIINIQTFVLVLQISWREKITYNEVIRHQGDTFNQITPNYQILEIVLYTNNL